MILARDINNRNKILLEKEAVSKEEYETSLSSLNSLKAQADVIRAQISRTEIRAPFSGVIGLRNVSPGGYLSPATSIATLVNIDPAKVTFSVPERYLPIIGKGSKVTFTVESSRDNFNARFTLLNRRLMPTRVPLRCVPKRQTLKISLVPAHLPRST
jgi:membrane fusion protein (multidrug efflux system)